MVLTAGRRHFFIGYAVLGYWDRWLAHRAAAGFIAPLIERTLQRTGPISEMSWRDPYILGFLSMLITLLAIERTGGRLQGEKLGLVQLGVLQEITHLADDRVGEDVLFFSAGAEVAFIDGCRNARNFLLAARGLASLGELGLSEAYLSMPDSLEPTPSDAVGGSTPELTHIAWHLLFERRISIAV